MDFDKTINSFAEQKLFIGFQLFIEFFFFNLLETLLRDYYAK